MFKRILLALLFIPSLVLAQGGQDKLLLNGNGNVVVGTTSATGDFRVIHNGVVVLTSVAGGVELGGKLEGGLYIGTNNTPLQMEDQSGNAHDVLRVDSGGNTDVIAPTGEFIEFTIADTIIGSVGGTGIAVAGTLSATSTITSSRTTDLGWAVVAGANTACNTTCTNACVFGVNTASATADIVDCADATADKCLCAGAN